MPPVFPSSFTYRSHPFPLLLSISPLSPFSYQSLTLFLLALSRLACPPPPLSFFFRWVCWLTQRTLADIEDAFYGIFANFPSKTLSLAMRGVAFPTGRCYSPPSDTLSQEVSQIISTDTAVRAVYIYIYTAGKKTPRRVTY